MLTAVHATSRTRLHLCLYFAKYVFKTCSVLSKFATASYPPSALQTHSYIEPPTHPAIVVHRPPAIDIQIYAGNTTPLKKKRPTGTLYIKVPLRSKKRGKQSNAYNTAFMKHICSLGNGSLRQA